jgi:acetyl-CoA acyltransferase
MAEAVIVSAVRTAVGKAKRGTLVDVRPDDMAAVAIGEALRRAGGVEAAAVEDVIMGCSFPEGAQGMNVARIALLRAGLPVTVPGQTVNRSCASGLQSIAMAAERIRAGWGGCMIAGGTESMSMVPMCGETYAPNPWLLAHHAQIYMPMGETAEQVARAYGVSRQDQDAFGYRSHVRAIAAQDAGAFVDQIVPLRVPQVVGEKSETVTRTVTFDVDEGPRRNTSLEAMAQLRPAFMEGGTVTAGNASQMSDGAAALMVMAEDRARGLGLQPLARFVGYAVGGVPPEVMGIGPTVAVPKVLAQTGLSLQDIDLIELNEAFASQALAVIRTLDLDLDRVNVNGGAIALGHPLGCTGAKLTVQLLYEMQRRDAQFGLVTMCVGGGMGAAGILERLA